MIKNYFYDANGLDQKEEVKREIVVAAVLEIVNSAAVNTGVQNSLNHIQNKLSETVDAIQAVLEKK
ncbi:TPA: hypothetical protein L9G83_005597 [Klebsiella pneumoniae]|uniref:hypothetical protein n=1 Tax=Klebsiella pneumoniae complex TaxID=3390273 RepID=UPI0008D973CF|nr:MULTISPECIES: hypothetical protein [Klebsiella]HCI5780493.1 hypothetical protein [Klebsiella quasipneumoniae subsp. quasipneumoniae]HDU3840491.1 hypothetical protein [Klebsiella pneumoniae subsp. pneumoniae]EJM0965192.1 hypothetical protein [Klebsiella pneumoniae]MBJ3773727.1 hypothetical protein [Klebsiella pneumoniae]MBP3989249.1 hypothetical protein [Klebsiella pneumoniae]